MSEVGDAVEAAINDALNQSGEMVTRWVAIIETIDADGDRGLFRLTNVDAPWDVHGMLDHTLASIRGETAARAVGLMGGDD